MKWPTHKFQDGHNSCQLASARRCSAFHGYRLPWPVGIDFHHVIIHTSSVSFVLFSGSHVHVERVHDICDIADCSWK